jgi:hypothetical protein
MRVFNEESIFISSEKCFCTVFLQILHGFFTAHARCVIILYTQCSHTSIIVSAQVSVACREVYVHYVPCMLSCETVWPRM